jgi:hypothetical protein
MGCYDFRRSYILLYFEENGGPWAIRTPEQWIKNRLVIKITFKNNGICLYKPSVHQNVQLNGVIIANSTVFYVLQRLIEN